MRAADLCALVLALFGGAACGNDSTDISGTYLGSAIYAASVTAPAAASLSGAEPWTVVVANEGDSYVSFQIDDCMLMGALRQQEQVEDKSGEERFVFTSDGLAAGQACALPVTGGTLTVTLAQGDSVVDHGGTMTLELGGDITAAAGVDATGGYAAFTFQGGSD